MFQRIKGPPPDWKERRVKIMRPSRLSNVDFSYAIFFFMAMLLESQAAFMSSLRNSGLESMNDFASFSKSAAFLSDSHRSWQYNRRRRSLLEAAAQDDPPINTLEEIKIINVEGDESNQTNSKEKIESSVKKTVKRREASTASKKSREPIVEEAKGVTKIAVEVEKGTSKRSLDTKQSSNGSSDVTKSKDSMSSEIRASSTTVETKESIKSKSPTTEKSDSSSATQESTAIPKHKKQPIKEAKVNVVPPVAFNVVLTHCTADFDSLASAVGLAKLWTARDENEVKSAEESTDEKTFKSASHVPTFVVLPRGAHPGVQKFLSLHKHLFPIRSLKSLPNDLSGLNRLALVDAQRRDRLGPAESLLVHANRVVVVDHHVDQDSDIPATDYVVDKTGSVSTLICEYLKGEGIELSEVEATLLALGIHADTGSLCFDSTTPRDAMALAWCLGQGASQTAIAEHAQTHLSREQQNVLTQALVNVNSTTIHGITLSTVLLSADGFINGLAAVTQDALDLSSSDIFLMGMVYEATSGRSRKAKSKSGQLLTSRLLTKAKEDSGPGAPLSAEEELSLAYTEAWKGGKDAQRRSQLRRIFDQKDTDASGNLDRDEIGAALSSFGMIASEEALTNLFDSMDTDGNGRIDFEEFLTFVNEVEKMRTENPDGGKKSSSTTMIIVGRAKAGVQLKAVKLNKMFEKFGGGGHPKAASATVRLNQEAEAADVMQDLVDELISTGLQEQPTVGDFMTAPALSISSSMNEIQVEDIFTRYDVRALPVVDEENSVIGLVTYKEVASAKVSRLLQNHTGKDCSERLYLTKLFLLFF